MSFHRKTLTKRAKLTSSIIQPTTMYEGEWPGFRLFVRQILMGFGQVAPPTVIDAQYFLHLWDGMNDEDQAPYHWGAFHEAEAERRTREIELLTRHR